MGYERNDRRYDRDERGYGRSSERGYGTDAYRRDPYGREGYGRDAYNRDAYNRDRDEDRGFFERAGDEVRSWFGDEEAERRRRADEAADERYDREQGRDRFYRDRYASGEAGGYRSPDHYPSWQRSNRDEGYARGRAQGGQNSYGNSYGGSSYGGSPFGGVGRYDRADEGRQFDDGGSSRDAMGYGASDYGARGGSDRGDYRAATRGGSQRRDYGGQGYGGSEARGYGSGFGRDDDDAHADYRSWRDQQVSAFDRDYDEYRRQNRDRFHSEFSTWRSGRQTQRDSLGQVQEHQEVVGSDGGHVGTVDHVRSDHILLTKNDKDAGGHHHAIPSSWIASVADKVTLSKTADEAKRAWRDAEERGGLFGEGEQGRGETQTDTDAKGRGNLDRSFSGTY